jgi:hypothetical protein
MPIFLTPAVRRALLLAIILAAIAAVTAPAARGSTVPSSESRVLPSPNSAWHLELGTGNLVLAEDWSWHEFVKFWQRHLGSMSGVVGAVTLVAAVAALIILSKNRI